MVPWDLVALERDRYEAPEGPCQHCDLESLAFCAGLSPDQSHRFMTIVTHGETDSGTAIFHEGDPADHLYTVTSGAVKLYKLLSDGRRQITAFLFPGDVMGLSNGTGYACTAEALSSVNYCRFPRRRLEALFLELPVLERRLLGSATQELASAQEQMLMLGRMTARERVASFLVAMMKRLSVGAKPAPLIHLPMSRSDIADFLGLTIETVSRTLTSLKRDGMIGLPDAYHVAVLDGETLRSIAAGE